MKNKLIAILCLLSITAHAKDIAYFKNQGGGSVMLTDDVCTKDNEVYKELLRAYAFNDKGESIEGCYYVTRTDNVRVMWVNGQEKLYPSDIFKMLDHPKPTKNNII